MKKIKGFLAKLVENISEFLANYIDDLLVLIGMLITVIATFVCFGIGVSLYVLGIFLIITGIVDFNRIRG